MALGPLPVGAVQLARPCTIPGRAPDSSGLTGALDLDAQFALALLDGDQGDALEAALFHHEGVSPVTHAFAAEAGAFAVLIPIASVVDLGTHRLLVGGEYPRAGNWFLRVAAEAPVAFKLMIRIPLWAEGADFEFPDEWGEMDYENGYATLKRCWADGDEVKVTFPMTPQWVMADPARPELAGKVAVRRGPLLFATLEPNPHQLVVDTELELADEMLVEGWREAIDWPGDQAFGWEEIKSHPAAWKLVPYAEEGGALWLRRA